MTPDEIKAALSRNRDHLDLLVLDFIAAVTARYLSTGKDLTVPEIAECMGWGEAKVRKLLARHGGCPNGLQSRQDERPSYSKSYRAMQSGVHKVWVYGPTRETLRELVNQAATTGRGQAELIGRLEDELHEWLPACARDMRCYCAGHARGNPADAPCDTSETAQS